MITLSNESLVTVVGGRNPLPTEDHQRQQDNYSACVEWARATRDDRRADMLGACTDEYVRRNWDNFGRQLEPY